MRSFKKLSQYGIGMIIIITIAGTFFGCQSKQADKEPDSGTYYTCSMHPQVHKDKPGDCPICGMKLIKVEATSVKDTTSLDSALTYLTESVTQTVVGSFKVIEPVKLNHEDTLSVDGAIGFDQRDVNTVSSRVSGRVEKVYVKYTNQSVQKGQPLMDIYSPQLVSVQRDLLQTIRDKDEALTAVIKEKLLNLGMHDNEIQQVVKSGDPLRKITLYSPYPGISQQTNTSSTTRSTPELLNIREGMYVKEGQTIFSIQNIRRIWALLNVFNENVGLIHQGDPVLLYADADKGNGIKGRIDFIPPYRTGADKTTSVRVYLKKLPTRWKIGTLIHGEIAISSQGAGWYVPLSAVNRLGRRNIIWIQDKDHEGVFHVREVQTGIQTGDSVEIISGINPGEKIVKNAAYMVGSDSFIQ